MDEIRLNKAIAQAGFCSRRKADEYIAQGHVTVNGEKVTEMGLKLNPAKDIITVKGQKLSAKKENKYFYLLLHKPIEVISSVDDPEKRKTVIDFIPKELSAKRLYPVGRLDFYSEGLLLLTNDGKLTHRMTHPRYELSKTYEIELREKPSPEILGKMHKGMLLSDGEKLAPMGAEFKVEDGKNILYLVLRQGINRQIRRMCKDFELTILKLKRISIGEIKIGSLPYGKSRPLTKDEIKELYKSVDLKFSGHA